jgi:Mn-dependent DtxR family transcriptional regulator
MITNDKRVLDAIKILQEQQELITYQKIQVLTMVSDRTVVRSVRRLQNNGYLTVTRPKPGLPYEYRILAPNGDEP